MSATGMIVRDFVTENYIHNPLDAAALMLLSCADMIDRLTVERDAMRGVLTADQALQVLTQMMAEADRTKPKLPHK
jgi:hypothetical protein